MSIEENEFDIYEDKLLKKLTVEYEQKEREAVRNAAVSKDSRMFISSDRYFEMLSRMNREAEKTAENTENIFSSACKKTKEYEEEIQNSSLKIVEVVKKESENARKLIKITSKQSRRKFITMIVGSFSLGVFLTVFIYHAFIIGIMNRYLNRTISIMAEKQLTEARSEAQKIISNANIKADSLLQGTKEYSENNKQENGKDENKKS